MERIPNLRKVAEHGNCANAKLRQNGQKWLITGVNFEISKTCGKKLQKQMNLESLYAKN